ncbi:hypothetical protein N0V82_010767 [Gnomoniopsis sp. IMI 355080]|nr:hypothetical protein N0V82_010767 [Gnomoniopsis sp. IMI 355080]
MRRLLAGAGPRDDLILAVHTMRLLLALAIAGFHKLIEPTSASFLLGYHHHTNFNFPQWWQPWSGMKKEDIPGAARKDPRDISDLSHTLTSAARYVVWGEAYLAQLDHLEKSLIGLAGQTTHLGCATDSKTVLLGESRK